jgi:hypothetical protein
MAELVRHQFGIDPGLTRQAGVRSAHYLKVYPIQTKHFQFRFDISSPQIVAPDGCGQLLRREDPRFGIVVECFRSPEFDCLPAYPTAGGEPRCETGRISSSFRDTAEAFHG